MCLRTESGLLFILRHRVGFLLLLLVCSPRVPDLLGLTLIRLVGGCTIVSSYGLFPDGLEHSFAFELGSLPHGL